MALTNYIESSTIGEEKRRSKTYNYKDELNVIYMDHCYSRPYSQMLGTKFLRPTKTLFIPQKTTRKSVNPLAPQQDNEDIIDVETLPADPPIIYDNAKAKHLMQECERYAANVRSKESDNSNWEEKIAKVKLTWTPVQCRLYTSAMDILNSDYMARFAVSGVYNEPIVRRNIIDKSVSRFRQLMITISWDIKLLQWLSLLLIENLSSQYLSIYLDLLQTLKLKLPTFVDKLLLNIPQTRVGGTNNENLFSLLKRPWDPVAPSLNQDKPKKLPGNPIIIVIPPAPVANANQFKRLQKWITLLSNLATVIPVYTNVSANAHRMTMMNCLDQMLATTRAKVQEVKDEYPGRSVILAGFNAGSSLALQVAQVESVLCVLCLGFSLLTADGKRGDPDDNLLELQYPVLFVIGQCSNTSLQEDMEDLRERMRVETGLIVVGSADDYLRISKKKKRAECITQSVVDRCIVDEVGEFISNLLLSPFPPQIRMSPSHVAESKSPSFDRKRNNSNGSSLDSEPSSPTTRIIRPDPSKFITSKKQLIGNKTPRPIKKLPYVAQQANLPLATNLTSQDIMDLPIIFADDNQMLTNNMIQPNDIPQSNIAPLPTKTATTATAAVAAAAANSGKIVFINKQSTPSSSSSQAALFQQAAALKRPAVPIPVRTSANSVKYAKIILSKRATVDELKPIPVDATVKNDAQVHDIESQLVATALPNPKFTKVDGDGTHTIQLVDLNRKRAGEQIDVDHTPSKIQKTEHV